MAVILKCPKCEQKYRWNAAIETAPEYCPNQDCDWQDTKWDDSVVTMPFIKSARTKANDQVYRDIERSSEVRAEQAAVMAGVPVSEMAGLKITNLNDRKDAEIAAPPVPNIGQKYAPNGAEFSAGIASGDVTVNGQTARGIAPRAGMRALSGLKSLNGRG